MKFTDFYQKYEQIKNNIPRNPTLSTELEESEFVSHCHRLKKCYFCFDTVDCEHCLYCFDSVRSKHCVDSDYVVECELLYECNDTYQSYNSTYLDYCARLYDSHYCWDCFDSHDLFGCVHAKHKQYCIFNQQYTKKAYFEKISDLLKQPAATHLLKMKELIDQYPLGPTNISHSENCDYGNQVHYSSNCYLCFDVARSENCAYMYDTFYSRNSYDLTYCYKAELCYECIDCSKIYNCNYCEDVSDCFDSSYLYNCSDCHNCFGCVGLTHKRFCYLNKQYTQTEYEHLLKNLNDWFSEL